MRWMIRCSEPGCAWQSEATDPAIAASWKDMHRSTAPGHAVAITADGAADAEPDPGARDILVDLAERAIDKPGAPAAGVPSPAPEPPGRRRILIVDDDPLVREALRHCLQFAGYEVAEAAEGEEALARVRERPPQAMLLDIRMPGVDGYTVCERLQDLPTPTRVPVIIITGFGDFDLHRRAYAVGASACLTKPVRLAALVGILEAVLATAGQRDKAKTAPPQPG